MKVGIVIKQIEKSKYSVKDLLKLVAVLKFSNSFRRDKARSNNGIQSNLIEQAYEALEAIDLEDSKMLEEKLGDILFQIVYRCGIEEESKNFSFEDLVDSVCKKIISKYPHIFPEEDKKSLETKCKVYNMRNHDLRFRYKFKNRDLKADSLEETKNSLKTLPALMRTLRIQEKAARLGYGLFSVEDALNETFERLHYLETLILDGRQDYYEKEIGDLLFSIAEIARLIDVDPEISLYNSCERFKNEFLFKI